MIVTSALWLILNIVFVSFPEELFIVLFTLALMGRYSSFIKLNSIKILKLSICVIVPAVSSALIRIYSGYSISFMPVIGIVLISSTITATYRINDVKEAVKGLLFVSLASIIIMILELFVFTYVISGTSLTEESFNRPVVVNIIFTIPERMIEALIVFYLVSKKNRIKISMTKIIFKRPLYIGFTTLMLTVNFIFIYLVSISIVKNSLLIGLDPILQLIILITIISFPILNLSALFITIYHISYKNAYENKFIQGELFALKIAVNNQYANGNYKDILEEIDNFYTFWGEKQKYIP